MQIKISRSQWEQMGKQAGWYRAASFDQSKETLRTETLEDDPDPDLDEEKAVWVEKEDHIQECFECGRHGWESKLIPVKTKEHDIGNFLCPDCFYRALWRYQLGIKN